MTRVVELAAVVGVSLLIAAALITVAVGVAAESRRTVDRARAGIQRNRLVHVRKITAAEAREAETQLADRLIHETRYGAGR